MSHMNPDTPELLGLENQAENETYMPQMPPITLKVNEAPEINETHDTEPQMQRDEPHETENQYVNETETVRKAKGRGKGN